MSLVRYLFLATRKYLTLPILFVSKTGNSAVMGAAYLPEQEKKQEIISLGKRLLTLGKRMIIKFPKEKISRTVLRTLGCL